MRVSCNHCAMGGTNKKNLSWFNKSVHLPKALRGFFEDPFHTSYNVAGASSKETTHFSAQSWEVGSRPIERCFNRSQPQRRAAKIQNDIGNRKGCLNVHPWQRLILLLLALLYSQITYLNDLKWLYHQNGVWWMDVLQPSRQDDPSCRWLGASGGA